MKLVHVIFIFIILYIMLVHVMSKYQCCVANHRRSMAASGGKGRHNLRSRSTEQTPKFPKFSTDFLLAVQRN